jgi:hypothetical protein
MKFSNFKGSQPDKPLFYGPQDFYIGAVVNIFKHRFRIIGADLYVLKFAEEHPDQFPPNVLESLRRNLSNNTGRLDAREIGAVNLRRKFVDFYFNFVFKG